MEKTPMAVQFTLTTLIPRCVRECAQILKAGILQSRKLLLIFGRGGDRDKNKRPSMGLIAKYADSVMLTSDNPRNENPLGIIEDILVGIKDKSQIMINTDRELAINISVKSAEKNDVILTAARVMKSIKRHSLVKNLFPIVYHPQIIEEER